MIPAGKWCAAALLLFALTLPMTTCQTRTGPQEHHVTLSWSDAGTILWFVWPLPFLLARLLVPAVRRRRAMAIAECVMALAAWTMLTLEVGAAGLVSLGGIAAGRGYRVAAVALAAYFVLAAIEVRKAAALPPHSYTARRSRR